MKLFTQAMVMSGLASMLGTEDRQVREDSGETAIVARQLEYIKTELFNIEYATPKALMLVPLDTSVPAGADTFTYREWDVVGTAEIISNYGKDLNRVDILVNEYPQRIVPIGDAYGYTVDDLRKAAFAQVPLDSMKAKTAKEAIDRKLDALIALGNTATGLKGFLNHPNVPRVSVPNGDWLNPLTTPDEILADLAVMEATVINQTIDTHHPTTIVLPLTHYTKITNTARSANSDTTIKKFFLDNSENVKEIVSWYRCNTAGPGSAPMAVCYEKSPTIVQAVIPVPFEQLPPEMRSLEWIISCLARVGGTVWYRPLGGVYADGI